LLLTPLFNQIENQIKRIFIKGFSSELFGPGKCNIEEIISKSYIAKGFNIMKGLVLLIVLIGLPVIGFQMGGWIGAIIGIAIAASMPSLPGE
jgi:hypothetical protein